MPLARSDPTGLISEPPSAPELKDIYVEHAPQVARWVAHLGAPTVDVEDLVQEIFLIAGHRLSRFRGESKIVTWLYGITEHVVRASRRKDRLRRWLRRIWPSDVARSLSASQTSPVEHLERRRARDTVGRILGKLPEKYRSVLILFELEGLSGDEIAVLTGRQVATVWVHLHRARQRFLEEMNAEGEEDS